MGILSNDDLAARAGVNPWALQAKVAVGDPAQVETLAAAFYKAGGNMAQARADTRQSQTYRTQGYTTDGSSPIDVEAETRTVATSPENLQAIGKVLDAVASDLSGAIRTANSEVSALEATLGSIERSWEQFMQTVGHHLPPDDQEAVRTEYINDAVGAVKSHGSTIDTAVKKYEETIFGAQKSMSDLGYVPPAKLDDLYGDGAEYIAQLQKQARAEADRLKNNHELDGSWATDAHQVAGDIAPYLDDPYYASAFYGELGPQLTQLLPDFLYQSGSSTAAADLKTFSHAFGTAVSNAGDDPNMQAVADSFLTKPAVSEISFSRAAMASNGTFPPDWLAKAARVNALDDFAQHGPDGGNGFGYDVQSMGRFAYEIGVSNNTVAAWTQDLGQSPVAAREALATMGQPGLDVTINGDPSSAYQTNIHKLIEYGKLEDYPGDVARGYGAMFQAASGANNETDGAHSAAASTFAKALFTDLGHDAGDVQPTAAQNFAKIGGSYIQEMAAGAYAADNGSGDLPGQHPAFDISPTEAREIMKTFVGDPGATQTFDDAAGLAQHDALLAAARADAGLPPSYADHMERTAAAYGTVAGTENSTTREVLGERDEAEEHQQELVRNIISAGVDLIPGEKVAEALAIHVPSTLWDISKHVTNMGLEQVFGATSDPRFDATTDASHAAAVTGVYEQTSILQQAGYPGTDSIPSTLIDPQTGHMYPVGKVLSDPNLQVAFHDYLRGQAQQHGTGHNSVYDQTYRAANGFQGGFDRANS